MAKLGYTWFPQNWRSSETFRRLKRFPMVRYALRELFDLMYEEGKPINMNREYLSDDFNIELSDEEYAKLMEYIQIVDGKWWCNTVSIRLNKAESSRINGAKGGRPKKTQKPRIETQEGNLKNPPLEREREIESKREIKDKINEESVFDIEEENINLLRDADLTKFSSNSGFKAKAFQGYEKLKGVQAWSENDLEALDQMHNKLRRRIAAAGGPGTMASHDQCYKVFLAAVDATLEDRMWSKWGIRAIANNLDTILNSMKNQVA